MNEALDKIKEFVIKIKESVIEHRLFVIIFFVCVIIYAVFVLCFREDISDNGNSTDAVRGELNEAQRAEQHIADGVDAIESTVGGLTDTIENAANASSEFEAILDECADIIDAIRKQPTN